MIRAISYFALVLPGTHRCKRVGKHPGDAAGPSTPTGPATPFTSPYTAAKSPNHRDAEPCQFLERKRRLPGGDFRWRPTSGPAPAGAPRESGYRLHLSPLSGDSWEASQVDAIPERPGGEEAGLTEGRHEGVAPGFRFPGVITNRGQLWPPENNGDIPIQKYVI